MSQNLDRIKLQQEKNRIKKEQKENYIPRKNKYIKNTLKLNHTKWKNLKTSLQKYFNTQKNG